MMLLPTSIIVLLVTNLCQANVLDAVNHDKKVDRTRRIISNNEQQQRQLVHFAQPTALKPTQTSSTSKGGVEEGELEKRQIVTASTVTTASVSIPTNAPAGGLSYIQPAITDAVSYYKIASGQLITFQWNYTSLYVTPTSLTFQARCSANSFTYPVGPTSGIPASQTSLVWDPYAYAQQPNAIPFAQASYTLRVYDERGIDAAATPGYFNGAQSVAFFALYSPAPYTPLASGWTCVACSAATLSKHLENPVVMAIPITFGIVLIGGAGVLWR